MKKIIAGILMLATLMFTGCSEDPAGPSVTYTIDDLVGTWEKTAGSMTMTMTISGTGTDYDGTTTETEDFDPDTMSETLVINSDGSYNVTFDNGEGYGEESDSGTLTISGASVTYQSNSDDEVITGTVSITGTTATFSYSISESETAPDGYTGSMSMTASMTSVYEKVE